MLKILAMKQTTNLNAFKWVKKSKTWIFNVCSLHMFITTMVNFSIHSPSKPANCTRQPIGSLQLISTDQKQLIGKKWTIGSFKRSHIKFYLYSKKLQWLMISITDSGKSVRAINFSPWLISEDTLFLFLKDQLLFELFYPRYSKN